MKNSIQRWMTPDPITIHAENTLSVAYNLMRINSIRHLPVVDDDEKLVGIITWGDVREARPKTRPSKEVHAAWEEHFLAAVRDVHNFMTPLPRQVSSTAPIQDAAALMIEHKISGLPVVDEERVVGIVTEIDLFRFIVGSGSEVEEEPLDTVAFAS